MGGYENKKMVGRKPKLYRFLFKELKGDEKTQTSYQAPSEGVYVTLSNPICRTNMGNGRCPTIPDYRISLVSCGDDNDITCECLACRDEVFFEQTRIPTDSDFFKGAITGKANEVLCERMTND